jgi:hypothetical protein
MLEKKGFWNNEAVPWVFCPVATQDTTSAADKLVFVCFSRIQFLFYKNGSRLKTGFIFCAFVL